MEIAVTQLVVFLLAFVRCSTLVITAPVIGHVAVPVQVKVALGLFLALVLLPVISAKTDVRDLGMGMLVLLALQEGVVGLAIGFASGMIFHGVRAGGELIGFELGFSMANVFDPESGMNNLIGGFLSLAMMLVFLLVNGHHFVIQALLVSYRTVPVGGLVLQAGSATSLIGMSGMLFVVAVKFAAPIIVASFLLNVALAVLTRVAPQMNVFALSFQLKIVTGLVVFLASAPLLILVFKQLLAGFEDNVLELLKVM